jgi:hypothetical protein
MRRAPIVLAAAALLLAAPGTASADVIFDPADADELANTLAEAYADQNVCYGWHVTVDDVGSTSDSVGSNFGAGRAVDSGATSCEATVEFTATITYTSEASESEDSASYDVHSSPPGVTHADLDGLGIDFDGLTGEDPDVPIGKAVVALPLLAADKGIADPLSAAPNPSTATDDAQLTDDPGSDWWRDRGGMVIWALILMAAGGVLVWLVLKTGRRRRPGVVRSPGPDDQVDPTPLYVSDVLGTADPDLDPAEKDRLPRQQATPEQAPEQAPEEPAADRKPTERTDPPTGPADTSPESASEPASTTARPAGRAAEPAPADTPAEPKSADETADPTSAGEQDTEPPSVEAPPADEADAAAADDADADAAPDDKPEPGPTDLKDKE